MKKIKNISEKIAAIINIPLENIVPDLRPLLAVLLLSPDVECTRLRMCHPDDQLVQILLENVKVFRNDEELFDLYAKDGFFAEQLNYMLSVARKNRKAGSRLMPVFCAALTDADQLNIPNALHQRIIKHIEKQLKLDGFAITVLEPGNIVIVPEPGYTAE